MELTRTLAQHLVSTTFEQLPGEARDATKRSIMDTLGVMLPPTRLERACLAVGELVGEFGGKQESTLLTGGKAPACLAAFFNGSLTHALDYDDGVESATHHPTASTLPAALAIAEKIGGVSGRDFITAVALGNDLSIRIATGIKGKIVEDYPWFPITTFGVFSAAGASGRLLGLPEKQMINALGIAFGRVGGITESISAPESEIRAIRDGFNNKEGLLAALMAAKDIAACQNPIEVLGKVLYRGEYDPEAVTRDLGSYFRGADVHLKAWPSCRETHGHINAALDIVRAHHPEPRQIDEVMLTVGPFGQERLCEPAEIKRGPSYSIGAKFSLPFTVAVALAKGRVEVGDFLPENLADPEVTAMTNRIRYRVDPSFGIVTPAEVEVVMKDGTRFSRRIEHVLGDPEIPLGEDYLIAKFKDCASYASPGFSQETVDKLIDCCLHLEEVPDIAELTALLRQRT
jgi:2-methylcitrate dehydratase PrpD